MGYLTARVLALFLFLLPAAAQVSEPSVSLSKEVQQFVRVSAAKVVLAHVRVIDGTGGTAVEDQNVVLVGGKIRNIEIGADVPATPETTVLDLHGYTVVPGIVGMHNHLFAAAHPNLASQGPYGHPRSCRK
jgi:adenine deaminase